MRIMEASMSGRTVAHCAAACSFVQVCDARDDAGCGEDGYHTCANLFNETFLPTGALTKAEV